MQESQPLCHDLLGKKIDAGSVAAANWRGPGFASKHQANLGIQKLPSLRTWFGVSD
jgi:hypothetical protein